jgi:hypothetical protein
LSCGATDITEQSAGGNGYLQILAFSHVLSLWRAATHEGHTLRPLTEHKKNTCNVAQVRINKNIVLQFSIDFGHSLFGKIADFQSLMDIGGLFFKV